jgi:hypothetical protein
VESESQAAQANERSPFVAKRFRRLRNSKFARGGYEADAFGTPLTQADAATRIAMLKAKLKIAGQAAAGALIRAMRPALCGEGRRHKKLGRGAAGQTPQTYGRQPSCRFGRSGDR